MSAGPSTPCGGSNPPASSRSSRGWFATSALAEELAQDTLVGALEKWPVTGLPDNPAAWLMTAAKHRAIDWLRRVKLIDRKHEELGRELAIDGEGYEVAPFAMPDDARADDIGDDLLRLIFVACHPVLSTDARVALTLRLLGGLTTDEIARAFLVPEPTIAQRIVRAKRTLSEAACRSRFRRAKRWRPALASVLEVIYLVFNEGYAATSGGDVDATGAVRRGTATGTHPRGADAGGARGARSRRADGDPGVALRQLGSRRTERRSCCSTRTARAGTAC